MRSAAVRLVALAVAVLAVPAARGQEFNCDVRYDDNLLQRTDLQYLEDFRRGVEQYLNERAWTSDRFEPVERIDCDVNILFTAVSGTSRFTATFVLQTSRPVYGTLQSSTVLQLSDEQWEFDFVPGTPLVFEPQRYDPITSLLDFYAYLALGYDYDTFSPLGGTRFFVQARGVAQIAQAQNALGWSTFGSDRGRVQLVTQLLDARYRPLRQAYHDVHLGGLDRFVRAPEPVRAQLVATLTALRELYETVSKQYSMDIFFGTKSKEIVGMLERSDQAAPAYTILVEMDPARRADYDRLVN